MNSEKNNFVRKVNLTDNVTYIDVNMKVVEDAWKRRDIDFIKQYPILVSMNLGLDDLKELFQITGSSEVEKIMNQLIELNNDPEFIAKLKEDEDIERGKMEAKKEIAENLINADCEPLAVSLLTELSLSDVIKIKRSRE